MGAFGAIEDGLAQDVEQQGRDVGVSREQVSIDFEQTLQLVVGDTDSFD